MSTKKEHFQNIKKYFALTQNDIDPMRNVFIADEVIYRGILDNRVKITEELFEKGIVDKLIDEGLLTDSKLEFINFKKYTFLVRQSELLPPTPSSELPPSLKRDIGLILLRIHEILNQYKMTLVDFNYNDICINKKGRPVFHNLDSIIYSEYQLFSFSVFYAKFLGPLNLVNERPELINTLQYITQLSIDEDISIRRPKLKKLIHLISSLGVVGNKINRFYFRVIMSPFYGLFNMGLYAKFINESLKEKRKRQKKINLAPSNWPIILNKYIYKHLTSLKFDGISQKWTNYHTHLNLHDIVNSNENWENSFYGPRDQALLKILDSIERGTLLDIGANNGYFSILSAKKGYETTAVDYDIGAIDNLYKILVKSNYELTIRPLILDFPQLNPETSLRFKSDVVFALGFVHHMRLVELLPWSVIVKKLSDLTSKVLVTEYKNDTGASNSNTKLTENIKSDYSLEILLKHLNDYFDYVEVVGDFSQVGAQSVRTMIVCKRL